MLIPSAEHAIVDIRKLRDYCLNPEHDKGQHKARLFSTLLGMTADSAIPKLTTCYPLWCLEVIRMTTSTVKLLDVVALTVDLTEYNLWRGQVGTVVETLAGGAAFEVEFSARSGRTYESLGLRPDQIMVLRFEPVSSVTKQEQI